MEMIRSTQQTTLSKAVYRARLEALRQLMKEKDIDAYLIVTDDFHASEYVGDYFKCRAYISGFTGSAGSLLVTADDAGLWTDGRYFLQARDQLDGTGIRLMKMGEDGVPSIPEFLSEVLSSGQSLGFDGRTVNAAYADKLHKTLLKKGIRFVDQYDLAGELWEDRPAFPAGKVWVLDEKYAGKSRRDKLADLRERMKEEHANYHLLASLDDIAWLYNIRGCDIAYTPVVLAYTLISQDRAILYVNQEAVSEDVKAELTADGVELRSYLKVYEDLKALKGPFSLMYDEKTTNVALVSAIPNQIKKIHCINPTMTAKAVKNPIEMENIRKAHIIDGVAVTRLIYWLKKAMAESEGRKSAPGPGRTQESCGQTGAAAARTQESCGQADEITELTVCRKLESFRKEGEGYLEQSFSPIAGYGAHGAIIHYDPAEGGDIPLEAKSFLLLDTGGQYYTGTTDITRTISLGQLTEEQKRHYTAVLRSNLNLAAAHFPQGTTGVNLDVLAREPLWELGLDYNHGTGHGVAYLANVHEGPNGFRQKESDGTLGAAFEEGMLTSDEPGLYLEGKYGIRLENLMMCRKAEKTEYGQFMRFETLTMVPYDREAILPELLSGKELARLNVYHARVFELIAPYLTAEERSWLEEETRPF